MGILDGQVALISGGARGMGAAEAALLVTEGARVVIGDVLDDVNEATAADVGEACRAVHLDVTSEDDWRTAVEATEAWFGPITVLVNNAGVADATPVEQTSAESFRRVVDINLTGTFLGMKASHPLAAPCRGRQHRQHLVDSRAGGLLLSVRLRGGQVGRAWS